MAENKKFNVVSIVVLAVLGVALIMGIVGLCLDWLSYTYEGQSIVIGKLDDLATVSSGFKAVEAFAIIGIIMTAGTIALYVTSKFVDKAVLKKVALALAIALLVCAVIAFILTFVAESTPVGTYIPAVGGWLYCIFGILGGVAGIVGAVKA